MQGIDSGASHAARDVREMSVSMAAQRETLIALPDDAGAAGAVTRQ